MDSVIINGKRYIPEPGTNVPTLDLWLIVRPGRDNLNLADVYPVRQEMATELGFEQYRLHREYDGTWTVTPVRA